MKVVACDPSKRVGLAWAKVDVGSMRSVGVVRSVMDSFADGSGGVKEVVEPTEPMRQWAVIQELGRAGCDVFVIEDFRVWPEMMVRDRETFEPDRFLAVMDFFWFLVEAEADELGELYKGVVPELVKQMPVEKDIVTDDLLRRFSLWRTKGEGGGKDAMAALKHLVAYLRKVNGGYGHVVKEDG